MDADKKDSAVGAQKKGGLTFIVAAVILIVALGAWLRFYRLGRAELWGDEILYLRMCHPGLTVSGVIKEHIDSYKYIGHLPSGAVLTNLGMKLQGIRNVHEIFPTAARAPSALLGVVTVCLVGVWGWLLTRRSIDALAALAVAAFSFTHIWYSREAYHYSPLMMYAMGVLIFQLLLVRGRPDAMRTACYIAGYFLSAFLLAFSHPSGIGLLAVTGATVLVYALISDRANLRPYSVVAVNVMMIAWVYFGAGQGQTRPPGSERSWSLLLPDILDAYEWVTLGPGWIRLVVSVVILGLGAYSVIREKSGVKILYLVCFPVLMAALYWGVHRFRYHPRYFLLLWPLSTWLIAAGITYVIERFFSKQRFVLLGVISILLLVNIIPGLNHMYKLRSKLEQCGSLKQFMEEELEEGTICLWDGGHAMRFIPGFHLPRKELMFGAINADSTRAFESGHAQSSLKAIRSMYPVTAFIDWGAKCEQLKKSDGSGAGGFDEQVKKLFPRVKRIQDPAVVDMLESGWLIDPLPRLHPDINELTEARAMLMSLDVYYNNWQDITDPVIPVFKAGSWRFVSDQMGHTLMLGAPYAGVKLNWRPGMVPGLQAVLDIGVAGIKPGRLNIRDGYTVIATRNFQRSGESQQIALPVTMGQQQALTFEYIMNGKQQNNTGAAYAVISFRSKQGNMGNN